VLPNLKLTNAHQNITNYDYVYIYFKTIFPPQFSLETIEGKPIKTKTKILNIDKYR